MVKHASKNREKCSSEREVCRAESEERSNAAFECVWS